MRPPRGAALGLGANPRGQKWGLLRPCRRETHPKSQQGLSGKVFCLVKCISLEAFSTRCSGLGIIESLLCSDRTFLKLFPCSIGNLPSAPVPCHPSLGGCHPCWGRSSCCPHPSPCWLAAGDAGDVVQLLHPMVRAEPPGRGVPVTAGVPGEARCVHCDKPWAGLGSCSG